MAEPGLVSQAWTDQHSAPSEALRPAVALGMTLVIDPDDGVTPALSCHPWEERVLLQATWGAVSVLNFVIRTGVT